ncbi:hypothetical protein [Brachyspira alvinipulli]|uniref:hypothetical protein n=1 Tax=Brachyspira alvinipulli TaxID=84379 RepID=UPI00048019A7|nr:hypothetical protein [Brachyspira alvinipulli]
MGYAILPPEYINKAENDYHIFESTIHTNKKDKTLYIKIKDYNDVNNSLCGNLNEIEDQFFDFSQYSININSDDYIKINTYQYYKNNNNIYYIDNIDCLKILVLLLNANICESCISSLYNYYKDYDDEY